MPAESPSLRQRTIDAPAHEWLDAAMLAAYLGLPTESSVNTLVNAGIIPAGKTWGANRPLWHWQTAVAISWARQADLMLVPKKEPEIKPKKGKQSEIEPNIEEDE